MPRPFVRKFAAVFFASLTLVACASTDNTAKQPVATTSSAKPSAITPAGIYAVGRQDITLVDKSRGTDGNKEQEIAPSATRTLPTMVLYPTGTDLGNAARDDKRKVKNDAPIAAGKFPLIVFSHGITASGPIYEVFLKNIAAHGYIVAAPTFPLTSGKGGWANITQVNNQPADVSFIIKQFLTSTNTETAPFVDAVAPKHVGVAGHSLGAITSFGFFNSCCQNPAVAAVAGISGILLPLGGNYDAPPKIPLLLLHGEKDTTLNFAAGSQSIFDTFTAVPRALVRYPDAGHVDIVYSDKYTPLTTNAINAFFDRELRDDDTAWRTLGDQLTENKLGSISVAGGLAPAA